MSDRVVVHRVGQVGEPDAEVARRLRADGVEIIEQTPHMILASGDRAAIARAIAGAGGWSVSEFTTVPHPRTREGVLKRPPQ
jgi:hypothetical protein